MTPHMAYRQQASPRWTRIDMLLALYNCAIERGEQARDALAAGQTDRAALLLAKARMIVGGLVSGVVVEEDSLTDNFLRLFEYVLHQLNEGTADTIEEALKVLRTLREGFEQARPEAVELERAGLIPPVDAVSTVRALA